MALAVAAAREVDAEEFVRRAGPGFRVASLSDGIEVASGLVLIVSIADGPMPQQREFVQSAAYGGVRLAAIVLTHVAHVDDDELGELVELEVTALIEEYFGESDDLPVLRIPGRLSDASTDIGALLSSLARLLDADADADAADERLSAAPFTLMTIVQQHIQRRWGSLDGTRTGSVRDPVVSAWSWAILAEAVGGEEAAERVRREYEQRSRPAAADFMVDLAMMLQTASMLWSDPLLPGWLASPNGYLGGVRPIDLFRQEGYVPVIDSVYETLAGAFA